MKFFLLSSERHKKASLGKFYQVMVIYVHPLILFIFLSVALVLVSAMDSSTIAEQFLSMYKSIFLMWSIYSPVKMIVSLPVWIC